MTNVEDMFHHLVSEGQHPRDFADTFVILSCWVTTLIEKCNISTINIKTTMPMVTS